MRSIIIKKTLKLKISNLIRCTYFKLNHCFLYIDYVSRAIRLLLTRSDLRTETYHIFNQNKISFNEIFEFINKLGSDVESKKVDEFIQWLINYYDNDEFKSEVEKLVLYTNIFEEKELTQFIVTSEKTNKILKKIGFEWKKPDIKEITQMIEYAKKIKFI